MSEMSAESFSALRFLHFWTPDLVGGSGSFYFVTTGLLFPYSPLENNIVYFRSVSPVLCPAFNCPHEMHLLITNYLAVGEGIFRYFYIELVDCQPD